MDNSSEEFREMELLALVGPGTATAEIQLQKAKKRKNFVHFQAGQAVLVTYEDVHKEMKISPLKSKFYTLCKIASAKHLQCHLSSSTSIRTSILNHARMLMLYVPSVN